MKPTNIPISLYIHLPWCVRKCPYCDFNSHQQPAEIPEADYIDQLILDLQHDRERFAIDRPLQTIFFGGGTPSLFSAKNLERLLNAVDQQWSISNNTEITLEANPGTAEQQKFADYRAIGINRLSIGVQSFHETQLKSLGRIHSSNEALLAFEMAQRAGFSRVNIDLMFGLPQQTIDEGLADLQQAIDLNPAHISWYELTLEPNTVFYKKPPKLPNIDTIHALHEAGQTLLAQHGFEQYEISAYAKTQEQCRHNVNYWQFGDYVGIGAGAHGKITQGDGRIFRTRKHTQPNSYLKASQFTAQETEVTADLIGFEYFLNALRLNQPISIDEMSARTGFDRPAIQHMLQEAIKREFIMIDDQYIYKTELGQRFLNELLILFL